MLESIRQNVEESGTLSPTVIEPDDGSDTPEPKARSSVRYTPTPIERIIIKPSLYFKIIERCYTVPIDDALN